jgi:hypothetical protein
MKNIDESVKEFNDELNAILDKLPKSGKHTQTFTSIVDILKVVAEKTKQIILCEDENDKRKIQDEMKVLNKQLEELLKNN